jgi:hypothetical protein
MVHGLTVRTGFWAHTMGDINSAIKHEATMTCRHREPQMRCLSTTPISKNLKPKA